MEISKYFVIAPSPLSENMQAYIDYWVTRPLHHMLEDMNECERLSLLKEFVEQWSTVTCGGR